MNHLIMKTISLFILIFFTGTYAFLQDHNWPNLSYDIHRNYPPLSLTKDDLRQAKTLGDLNEHFDADWIKECFLVEIFVLNSGLEKRATSKNISITKEQMELMLSADSGSGINVIVQYMPNNSLAHNDPKELDFSFTIEPEKQANFPGGSQPMKKYLKTHVASKVSFDKFKQFQLTVVKFIIDEEGYVVEPEIFSSSDDEKTDSILKAAVCNMPNWTPAEYANGDKIRQEFVLTVGDMESCVVPLLNLKPRRF